MIDPMTGTPMAGMGGIRRPGHALTFSRCPTGDTTPLQPLTPEQAEENPPALPAREPRLR